MECEMSQFYNKYLNYFVFMKLEHGDQVMRENDIVEHVYFFKKGDYELSFKKSIGDLTDVIRRLGGNHKKIDYPENLLNSDLHERLLKSKKITKVYLI